VDRPNGLVTRRIRSTNKAVNQVVARYNQGTLERDGSNGGFILRYNANPGRITIVAMGMTAAGASVNAYQFLDSPGTAGTATIFTDAQNVVFFRCQFGDVYDQNQEHTEVSISRTANDFYWAGFVTSTFNQ
jgi:hypothetical protein